MFLRYNYIFQNFNEGYKLKLHSSMILTIVIQIKCWICFHRLMMHRFAEFTNLTYIYLLFRPLRVKLKKWTAYIFVILSGHTSHGFSNLFAAKWLDRYIWALCITLYYESITPCGLDRCRPTIMMIWKQYFYDFHPFML